MYENVATQFWSVSSWQESTLSPFETFLQVMQQTSRPTCSLVMPIVGKLINMLSVERKVCYMDFSIPRQPQKIVVKVRYFPHADVYILCVWLCWKHLHNCIYSCQQHTHTWYLYVRQTHYILLWSSFGKFFKLSWSEDLKKKKGRDTKKILWFQLCLTQGNALFD